MEEAGLDVRVVDGAPTARIALSGRLDTVSAPAFQEQALSLVADATTFVLDCSELSYLSSAGLRTLLLIHKRLMAKGARLTLDGVVPSVRDVLDLTGFSGIFDVLG